MDHEKFDAFVRSFALAPSRRRIVLGLGAATLGASSGMSGVRQAEAACKDNRKPCNKDTDCCSGTCKKKNGEKKCRRTAGARGCTIEDICGERNCPGALDADCAVTVGGKPFCFVDGKCFACESNKDCVDELGINGARCVECAVECDEETNFRACVIFDAGEPT
jgi:hypothetical protein